MENLKNEIMKKIKDQVDQLNQYFKDKVINGDYKFIKASEYIAEVMIDGSYTFNFWIANGHDAFKEYSIESHKMNVINIVFDSDQEKETAYVRVMVDVNQYRKSYLKDEKIKAIEKLQQEIKAMEDE